MSTDMLRNMANAAGVILEDNATLDYNERSVLLAIRQWHARAAAAEADNARLREQVAALQAELDWHRDSPNRKVSAT